MRDCPSRPKGAWTSPAAPPATAHSVIRTLAALFLYHRSIPRATSLPGGSFEWTPSRCGPAPLLMTGDSCYFSRASFGWERQDAEEDPPGSVRVRDGGGRRDRLDDGRIHRSSRRDGDRRRLTGGRRRKGGELPAKPAWRPGVEDERGTRG